MKVRHDAALDYLTIDFVDEIEAKSIYEDGVIIRYGKSGNVIGIDITDSMALFPKSDLSSLREAVRDLLIGNKEQGHWPWLSDRADRNKKIRQSDANEFLLWAIVNLQQRVDPIEERVRHFAENTLGDPKRLWSKVVQIGQEHWESRETKERYQLHWNIKFHARIWRIANDIEKTYGGDARRIWRKQSPAQVLERLTAMTVGSQISPMIVGALIDTKQIEGESALKADTHVRRVLGRVFRGQGFDQNETAEACGLAETMAPGNTWTLDFPLYMLGRRICKAENPKCGSCYLERYCCYAKARQ